ncbi:hypothetical protein BOTNAR_0539g00090 [Botryotinia narcissicola]|uniref:Uncharacterized protein n=1 Tax=Botryotinia narcissicola TaxID=278944 RepID=A0A4Z1HIX4_9HELO|nr:hypothetical protein BOTNAR_0539g00090 [Botryotinia narcissicola]
MDEESSVRYLVPVNDVIRNLSSRSFHHDMADQDSLDDRTTRDCGFHITFYGSKIFANNMIPQEKQ